MISQAELEIVNEALDNGRDVEVDFDNEGRISQGMAVCYFAGKLEVNVPEFIVPFQVNLSEVDEFRIY